MTASPFMNDIFICDRFGSFVSMTGPYYCSTTNTMLRRLMLRLEAATTDPQTQIEHLIGRAPRVRRSRNYRAPASAGGSQGLPRSLFLAVVRWRSISGPAAHSSRAAFGFSSHRRARGGAGIRHARNLGHGWVV